MNVNYLPSICLMRLRKIAKKMDGVRGLAYVWQDESPSGASVMRKPRNCEHGLAAEKKKKHLQSIVDKGRLILYSLEKQTVDNVVS